MHNALKSDNADNTVNNNMLKQLARAEYKNQIRSAQQTTQTSQPTFGGLIYNKMKVQLLH